MDVVGLDGQFQDGLALLGTLLPNQGATRLGNLPAQHGFAPLRVPDEVVHNQVDTVFVSLIFRVGRVLYNNAEINNIVCIGTLAEASKALTAGTQVPQLARAKAQLPVMPAG
jgi:hypothetical protein